MTRPAYSHTHRWVVPRVEIGPLGIALLVNGGQIWAILDSGETYGFSLSKEDGMRLGLVDSHLTPLPGSSFIGRTPTGGKGLDFLVSVEIAGIHGSGHSTIIRTHATVNKGKKDGTAPTFPLEVLTNFYSIKVMGDRYEFISPPYESGLPYRPPTNPGNWRMPDNDQERIRIPPFLMFDVGGVEFKGLLDTGSDACLMSKQTASLIDMTRFDTGITAHAEGESFAGEKSTTTHKLYYAPFTLEGRIGPVFMPTIVVDLPATGGDREINVVGTYWFLRHYDITFNKYSADFRARSVGI